MHDAPTARRGQQEQVESEIAENPVADRLIDLGFREGMNLIELGQGLGPHGLDGLPLFRDRVALWRHAAGHKNDKRDREKPGSCQTKHDPNPHLYGWKRELWEDAPHPLTRP